MPPGGCHGVRGGVAGSRGPRSGGIRGLVALVREHGEALDATLQAEYGLGLGDVTAGRVTFRRLRGLVANLPVDGTALWRAMRRAYKPGEGKSAPPPAEWWTPERDLLAAVLDNQALQLWQAGGGQGSRPKPIRRPGSEPRAADGVERTGRPMTVAEFEAIRSGLSRAAGEERPPGADGGDVERGPSEADEDPEDREAGSAA